MRMTDLVIGEHYEWKKNRVKLLATGVVLKNYQHKGVQIELPGKNTIILKTVPARELGSTWEDFQRSRAEWDREEQIKRDKLLQMQSAVRRLRGIMEELGLYDPKYTSLGAYRDYAILTFENADRVHKLADVLYEFDARGTQ